MTAPDPANATSPTARGAGGDRQRYRPRQRTLWQRVPLSVKLLVPTFLVAAGWFGHHLWKASHAWLQFVREGAAVPALELTVFPDRLSFNAPSPPPPVGELSVQGDEVLLGRDLVAGTAFVRYRGPGIGTGYIRVEVGAPVQRVELAGPARMRGRVVVADGALTFGLRSLGLHGVAGARVQGLGGGEHGVLLCEGQTDADGWFVLEGFDARLPSLGIRVLAPGHALAFTHWSPGRPEPTVPVIATASIQGRAQLPAGIDAASLQVLARGLPGVVADLCEDGSFELDHVPFGLEPRMLLHGLPSGYTHRVVHGTPGDRHLQIEVLRDATIRGWVLDRATQRPLAGALVWHGHGPAGRVTANTRDDGSFELGSVPPGEIFLHAQHSSENVLGEERVRTGSRTVRIEEGVGLEKIIIRVD